VATRDLAAHTRRAEILVVAVGKPRLITADMVREGAIVVDVGINRVTDAAGRKQTVGDVDFEAVAGRAGWITPVPGGVGPVTVAVLLRNAVRAAGG
jgi:methylenetetrahydrofolate dehydrogenase (NADP+) / methenyltetrahydrofolate cyclohydrolase